MAFKGLLRKKKLFIKLVLSFFVLAILSVVIIYTAFTELYINSVSNELKQGYLQAQQRVSYDFDNVIQQISQSYRYLNQNTDICFYFYSDAKTSDAVILNRAVMYLRSVKLSNPFLDSIYLYNAYQEYPLIAGNYDIDITQFLGPDISKPAADSKYNIVFCKNSPVGGKMIRPLNQTVSLVFSGDSFQADASDKAIVFTLSREAVESYLKAKAYETLAVVDKNGAILFGTGIIPDSQSVAGQGYFKDIVRSGRAEGSFTTAVGGKSMIVTYVTSAETGFYVIGLNPIARFTESLNEKRAIVLAISISTLLLYSFIGLMLSRNIYSPIDRSITKIVETAKYSPESASNTDELSTISNVFQDVQKHIEELENRLRGEKSLEFETWLRSALASAESPGVDTDAQPFARDGAIAGSILVCALIDDYHCLEEGVRAALEQTICHALPGLLRSEFQCETVDMYHGQVALLIGGREEPGGQGRMERLHAALASAAGSLRQTLGVSLTFGVGSPCSGASDLKSSYAEALAMARNRFVLGAGRVIDRAAVEGGLQTGVYYPTEIEDQLQQGIRQNKLEFFTQNLDGLVSILRQYACPESNFVFSQVFITCIKTMNQVVMAEKQSMHSFLEIVNVRLARIETLEQGRCLMLEAFGGYQGMLEEIHRIKGNKQYSVVEAAKKYIDANYANSSLSVDGIAELVGYSPYYFSRLFKELTGMNAVDYIRRVRLEKAKELLGGIDTRISEIYARVGFTNPSHFSKVFKGSVGMTPTVYREYALKKK